MPRILVVRRGGLGDTLLMLPVVRALRRSEPSAAIEFAGVREFADVLAHFGAVDRACSSEDLRLWALGSDEGAAARQRLAGYSRIVGDDLALLAVRSPQTAVSVLDPRRLVAGQSHARTILEQLGLTGPIDEPLCARAEVAPTAAIALAPGSGGMKKNWPRERWLELAALLCDRGERIAVVVGPTELERDDPQRWPWPSPPQFVCGLAAPDLAEALRRCRAFVGNDSGVTHLAAAVAMPTVAIFGPTDPAIWAPPFSWATVCHRAGGVAPTDVLLAIHPA